jgi:hypothetical protein
MTQMPGSEVVSSFASPGAFDAENVFVDASLGINARTPEAIEKIAAQFETDVTGGWYGRLLMSSLNGLAGSSGVLTDKVIDANISMVKNIPGMSAEAVDRIEAVLKGVITDTPIIALLQALLQTASIGTKIIGANVGAPAKLVERATNRIARAGMLSPTDALYRWFRDGRPLANRLTKYGPTTEPWHREHGEDAFSQALGQLGLDEEWIETLIKSGTPLLSVPDIRDAFYRGIIGEDDEGKLLTQLGYDSETVDKLKAIATSAISPGDLGEYLRRHPGQEEVVRSQLAYGRYNPQQLDIIQDGQYRIPDLALAFRLYHFGQLTEDGLHDAIERQGYVGYTPADPLVSLPGGEPNTEPGGRVDITENILAMRHIPPTLGELRIMKWRGLIDAEQFKTAVRKFGFSPDDVDRLEATSEALPPPSDLIRFSVREIYDDKLRDKFEMDAGFPPRFAELLEKQGYSQESAQDYWAAHWRLPAPGQGASMLHRGIINLEEYQDLLKMLDYTPFWQKRVADLTFSLIPRRALSKLGRQDLLNFEGQVARFRQLGYSPDDARLLGESSVLDEGAPARELTKAEVLTAYRRGRITDITAIQQLKRLRYSDPSIQFYLQSVRIQRRDDEAKEQAEAHHEETKAARQISKSGALSAYRSGSIDRLSAERLLEAIGYLPTAVAFLLDAEDYRLAHDRREIAEKQLKRLYDAHGIEANVARARLMEAGWGADRAANIVTDWALEREVDDEIITLRNRQPTTSELRRWAGKGIISGAQFVVFMRELSYDDEIISYHLAEVLADVEQ